ncbi:unnamed protein product [Angiostrongylus costaricensis]|uniref:BTB_2 domain-containing protein n=1 Tax=Angiostrongylus costaricensis TaxID=334426 RepID=A0A158PHP9_ANGCS|nr:unnamed protein product [Angiostrongylus costaricensis]
MDLFRDLSDKPNSHLSTIQIIEPSFGCEYSQLLTDRKVKQGPKMYTRRKRPATKWSAASLTTSENHEGFMLQLICGKKKKWDEEKIQSSHQCRASKPSRTCAKMQLVPGHDSCSILYRINDRKKRIPLVATVPMQLLPTMKKKMSNVRVLRDRWKECDSDSTHEVVSKEVGATHVRLNIGGKSFCVRRELYTDERTLMHDIVESSHEERLALVDGCDPNTGEYYMERNSIISNHIVDFFSTGSLHKPQNICAERFKEELAFWRISHEHMASCCALPKSMSGGKLHLQSMSTYEECDTDFDGAYFPSLRLSSWRFLEDPQSSYPAAVFALLSVLFVFCSVVGLILGSMPEFQEDPTNASAYHSMHVKTNEVCIPLFSHISAANSLLQM